MRVILWTDVVTAVSSAVLALFALVAIWQLYEHRRDRHFRVIFAILTKWDSMRVERELCIGFTPSELRALVVRASEAKRELSEEDAATYTAVMSVADFFDDLGGYVTEGAVTKKAVARALKSTILRQYDRWQESIDYVQTYVETTNLENFKALASEMRKIRNKEQSKKR